MAKPKQVRIREVIERTSVAAAKWAAQSPLDSRAIIPWEYTSYDVERYRYVLATKQTSWIKIETFTKAHLWAKDKMGIPIQDFRYPEDI